MIQIGAKRTLERLNEMLDAAIDGSFTEERYDETELSRLETKWKQYFAASRMSMKQMEKERENIKALVSDISHQTKTPLANILLYGQLLEEKAQNEEEKLLAAQIVSQADKLQFLIEALIKMSRLESDVLEITPAKQKIRLLLERAAEAVRPKMEAKDISLALEGNLEAEAVYDLKWTREAVENILDNAVKYSPEGSAVCIRVREFALYRCIEIEDQGRGIAEEEISRIFQRFYRGQAVRQEEGIGIGLWLAREIIKRENGYIKVTSREGEGSCFGIYLPGERKS